MGAPPGPLRDLPAAPDPESSAGFKLFLSIVVVCGVSMVGLMAWGVVYLSHTDVDGVLGNLQDAYDAAYGPGTEELREAGCAAAIVLDIPLIPEEEDDAEECGQAEYPDVKLVTCNWGLMAEQGPDCGQVARVYAQAVPDAPAPLLVQIVGDGGKVCEGRYAHDGTQLSAVLIRD